MLAEFPAGFPVGLRVLAVDGDPAALPTMELLLIKCGYKVSVAKQALEALDLLRAKKEQYDLLITDINMPDMDGFKLLEIVRLEMGLPVIMLSTDSDFKIVMKIMLSGAADFLPKPVHLEDLRLIWKHVVKRSLDCKKYAHDAENNNKKFEDGKRQRDNEDVVDSEASDSQKRARVSWTPDLHTKFISAVNQLGINRAVPKKILDIMGVPGLTRENVASHLQKFRTSLKRNGIGLCESSLPMFAGTQNMSINSFYSPSANLTTSSYLLEAQKAFNGHSLVPLTRLSPSASHQSNFCGQNMMNSVRDQLGTQQFRQISSSMMKMSTQPSCYQSSNSSLNQLDCNAHKSHNPLKSDEEIKSTIGSQGELYLDNQADCHTLNNSTDEPNSVSPFEQENQLLSPSLSSNSDMHVQINLDSFDIKNINFEDFRSFDFTDFSKEHFSAEMSFDFDKLEFTDELLIAL